MYSRTVCSHLSVLDLSVRVRVAARALAVVTVVTAQVVLIYRERKREREREYRGTVWVKRTVESEHTTRTGTEHGSTRKRE